MNKQWKNFVFLTDTTYLLRVNAIVGISLYLTHFWGSKYLVIVPICTTLVLSVDSIYTLTNL